ncbi:unnamed protein product [Anisakis simplex]|uniref:DNA repair endonuclease XPF n=1 Tax=Anisakis simplex TaxID=6269 RepID=A0A3P6NRV8_ANISI|nr:unnamed protein product [Anisakis simplex]
MDCFQINDKDGSSADKESSRNAESKGGKKDTGDGSDVDNSEEGEGNVKNEMENNTVEEDEEEEEDPLLVIMAADRRYNLMRHLDALSPEIIIMLHADLTALRLIEMYKACKPEREVRIYVIMYGESNEEERYLCSLRREQLAFEELIRQQGTLLVSREYNTAREPPPRLKVIKSGRDSRKTNDETVEEKPKIIVDMREFNSELPTVVYKRGTDVIAATLEVADYVLSPQIAVERKSLDDLAQSLCNGRVFKQIDQMLRHYRNVILLVEANMKDGKKRGNVGPFQGELSKRAREIRFLFTVLIWSYPKMHIVWTINPTQSAEMFEEFKLNQPNPDVDHAVSIRGDEDERVDLQTDQPSDQGEAATAESAQQQSSSTSSTTKPTERQLNRALQRQLMKLPKMTQGDIKRMMLNAQEAKCLLDVINADSEQITSIVGNAVLAESLYSFFNMDFRTSKEQE